MLQKLALGMAQRRTEAHLRSLFPSCKYTPRLPVAYVRSESSPTRMQSRVNSFNCQYLSIFTSEPTFRSQPLDFSKCTVLFPLAGLSISTTISTNATHRTISLMTLQAAISAVGGVVGDREACRVACASFVFYFHGTL